ncbi:MAG TPA: photosynthetic complex assembly protein PuhC [Burkholderiaceae bacterium]|nr:photosynthetic complex assembly protein PuhC [Burkholderiaceae bacterium]
MSTHTPHTPTARHHDDIVVPRGPLIAIGLLLVLSVLSVAAVRLSGLEIRETDAPAVKTRALRFEDRPDGAVAVLDARSGLVIDQLYGEQGFVRGVMRGLARERKRRGVDSGPAFELVARDNGRLTLLDPSTGQRIDLESFGPNAQEFARLLDAPLPSAGMHSTAPRQGTTPTTQP